MLSYQEDQSIRVCIHVYVCMPMTDAMPHMNRSRNSSTDWVEGSLSTLTETLVAASLVLWSPVNPFH